MKLKMKMKIKKENEKQESQRERERGRERTNIQRSAAKLVECKTKVCRCFTALLVLAGTMEGMKH